MKRVYHTVYLTENKINGKIYVGKHSTTNPNDNYLGSGRVLAQAVRKHGKDNFEKRILGIFETEAEAFEFEKITIKQMKERGYVMYNILSGGEGITSEFMLLRWRDQNYRKALFSKIRNTNATTDVNERRSNSCKRFWNEENRDVRRQEMVEKCKDPAFIASVSEGLKKHWMENYETRCLINAELNNRPEVKEKHRKNTTERWKDPEYVRKTNEARNKAMQTKEFKDTKSASSKKMWDENRAELIQKRKEKRANKLAAGWRYMRPISMTKGGSSLVRPSEFEERLNNGWRFV